MFSNEDINVGIGIVNVLFKVYDYWREFIKGQSEEYIPERHEFVTETICDVRNHDTMALLEIRQELIDNDQIQLAKKVDDVIEEIWRLSDEAYILLESYLESNEFYQNSK